MGFLFVFVLLMIIISHLIQPFGKKTEQLFWSILAFLFRSKFNGNKFSRLLIWSVIWLQAVFIWWISSFAMQSQLAFRKSTVLIVEWCGSGLIGIQIMSKSRCSSKRYDMISPRSYLEVERFQNVCKANYPPHFFVFWRCWYNELLFTTKIFYFFDQDYLVKIHKDLTYSVWRPYVRKYDCQSRSWTILYKNLRNKRELWRLASMK